jgi:IS1 family transposase
VIGNTIDCAKELYNKTKRVVGNIAKIYTDANSMYMSAFEDIGISDLHYVGIGKSETHMIEATNSSIRDNIARFNRKSKRYSKCYKMLENILIIFCNKKQFKISM